MINGKEYGWEDITAYMGGRDVMGFRSIKPSNETLKVRQSRHTPC